jgi:hypothetical protein
MPDPQSLAVVVGNVTRGGRKHFGRLPGVTATADLIAARHCVDLLSEGLNEDPADPRRHLWLAEALIRVRRDMRRVRRLWAVGDPSSIIVRTAVSRAAALGEGADAEEPAVRLLRRAFHLARARVQRREADATTLHVLARVYLAQGMPADALRLARLAAAAESGERADVFVTAARAFAKLGRRADAARMAERAIEHGSSLGYELLAYQHVTDRTRLAREPGARVAGWRDLRRQVRLEDRERHFGAARTPAQVAKAVKSAQMEKTGRTVSDAVNLAARARDAVTKEPKR